MPDSIMGYFFGYLFLCVYPTLVMRTELLVYLVHKNDIDLATLELYLQKLNFIDKFYLRENLIMLGSQKQISADLSRFLFFGAIEGFLLFALLTTIIRFGIGSDFFFINFSLFTLSILTTFYFFRKAASITRYKDND